MTINMKLFQRSEYKALEFKHSMAQENIIRLEEQLKLMKETQAGFEHVHTVLHCSTEQQFENQSQNMQTVTPPKEALDAVNQTDAFERKDESCQTDNLARKDFQIQACLQQKSEPIATQTDISPKCDFQVQANIPRENHSIAVQTIKQEIAMPNLPSSTAETPTKKRKSKSTENGSREIAMPNLPSSTTETPAKKQKSKSTQNGSREIYMPNLPSSTTETPTIKRTIKQSKKVNNEQANVGATVSDSLALQSISNGSGDRLNDNQASLDDSILKSEVYKIYTRNDPKEAMKQIKNLKNCILFEVPTQPFHSKDLKRACEKILDNLWKIEPGISKFLNIKKYVECKDQRYAIYGIRERNNVFSCYTTIRMLNSNGYEYWYVANFEKGPVLSKWHRAESIKWDEALRLAQLNVMGITKATLDPYFKKRLKKISWFDFAFGIVKSDLFQLFRCCTFPCYAFDVEEIETGTTIEVNATFRLTLYTKEKAYHGKFTRQFQMTRLSKNEKEMVEKEAKKAALVEFYKERFGFNKFDDWFADELCRPIDIE